LPHIFVEVKPTDLIGLILVLLNSCLTIHCKSVNQLPRPQ
jgi:hypothetical protein